ncbi:MAG: hypothetical protein CL610_06490 [Anaerolineaceae bacterium]|nr:hypothetical protein [Anaerolineaceae bacterium]
MKRSSVLWIVGIVLLLVLALLPWLISAAFAPLRPAIFEETVTVYSVTEGAFLTREAALELSATSEMITLPPEELEPLPGDPDYTPPASWTPASFSQQTGVQLVQLSVTQATMTGISALPLDRHSCPSPYAHISGPFPPNQAFLVLGWNVDLDGVVYLLIEDDQKERQVWLQIPDLTAVTLSGNYLETPAITCRTYIIETSETPELAATPVVPETGDAAAAATIPLPRIASATPPPPIAVRLEITEQDAIQQVQDSVPELRDPQIEISPEGLQIHGYIDLPGPLGTTLQGDVAITAELVQQDSDLRVNITSVTVAGQDLTGTEDGQQVENTINNWFNRLFIRRDLQGFELQDGLLLIDVLERQYSEFPEPAEQTEEADLSTATAVESPIATITLIVSTTTPTDPPSPLPMWTQTPSPPA